MRSDAGAAQEPRGARTFIETARRQQLVDAAIATVNELGYHRASLAEIGKRARIAKSAVVYYFSSKEALLLEVLQTVFGALGGEVAAAVERVEGPAARLGRYADAYLAHVDTRRRAVAAAVEIAVSHRTAEGRPLYLLDDEADTALLRSILRAGMDDGTFRSMPLEVATGLVESVLDRSITLVQRDPDADLAALRAEAVPFLLRALGAQDV
ncbi:TetR/AcrR family transcriptional regulator [Desertihabitans brevis]|uniref:TetR/AcrR family transcriptional regulator n=1 Tax=Desertihabitans brevis TaxID=2268447 RepID=A0A367YZD5_9ACTN|nr:TetR/AcrR family transcriptional regulator [Desertihabitans brevis]RCK71220.1 TetR/AcrR family transcriptional regulator [Desertihabitans brevis]